MAQKTYYIYQGKKFPNRAKLEMYLLEVHNIAYNEARYLSGVAETITVKTKPRTKKVIKKVGK